MASPVDIDFISFAPLLILPAFLYATAIFYLKRNEKKISAMCEVIAAGWLLLIPVLASTYLAMSIGMPLVDEKLIAMDKAIGFNWDSFIQAIDQYVFLSKMLEFSYITFEYQIFIVPLILIAYGQTKRAYAFVCGYGLLCFISSIIAIWYPALGTYAYWGFVQADMNAIDVRVGFNFLESFNAVRSGELFVLSLGVASGIVTFPSVHVGIALLLIWATWNTGMLRYPFLAMNIAMAVSAITHGSHYFVDVIMGAGVTGLTISMISYAFLKSEYRKNLMSPVAVSG